MKNYYQILGLKYSASELEIKEAYRKLVHKFHPDKNGGDKFFENHFKEIQEAYETLNNNHKKIIYDNELLDFYNKNNSYSERVKKEDYYKKEDYSSKKENSIVFTDLKKIIYKELSNYQKKLKSFEKGTLYLTIAVVTLILTYIFFGDNGNYLLCTFLGFWMVRRVIIGPNFRFSKPVYYIGLLLLLFNGCSGLFVIFDSFDNEKKQSTNESNNVADAVIEMTEAVADTAAVVAPESSLYGSESPSALIDNLSKYSQNQLSNGASPFNECFGSGKTGGNAYIVFDNGNKTDVVVCLTDYYSGTTIRNEYIRAGEKYKVKNIPSGTYTIKGYYGNSWNPTKQNFCGTQGGFEQNEHFSKSDRIGDLIKIENTSRSYTEDR